MSLIKCRRCGEMFSDSYKTCPFCEEDDAYYGGRVKKRRSRRAEAPRRKAPSILGPVVVLVLILLVLLVVWLLFGEKIKTAIVGEKPPITDVTPTPDPVTPDPVTPAATISLNRAVLALDVGEKETLKVNEETEETCTWSSSDPTVATVSDSGEVTALAAGNAVITAKVGDAEATCSLTVKDAGDSTTTPDNNTTKPNDNTTKPNDNTTKPNDNTTKPNNNTSTTVDVSKLVITATSEYGYTGELAATGEPGEFEMTTTKGEVWTLGVKGTTAAVKWSIDGDSSSVCTLEGDKLTVTGTTSGRYATVVGTVGGGTIKAYIRIR